MSTQSANSRKIPNPIYAAAGAGDYAYQFASEQIRQFPANAEKLRERVVALRPAVTDAVTKRINEPTRTVDVERLRAIAKRNAETLRVQADQLRTRAETVYTELVARGEKIVGGPYKKLTPAGDIVPEVTAAEGRPAPATTTGATAAGGPGTGKSPAKATIEKKTPARATAVK